MKRSRKSVVRKLVKAAPKTLAGTKKLIHSIVKTDKEVKNCDYSVAKVELYHNTLGYNFCLTAPSAGLLPPQGDTDNSRDGNHIYLSGQSIRIIMGCKLDRLNTKYRVTVVQVPKLSAPSVYADFYDNITGNVMIDPINTDRCKVIYSKVVQATGISPVNFDANKEKTTFLKIWVPYRTKLGFLSDAVYNHDLKYDRYLVISAYDTYGSLTTDNIAWVQTYVRTYFREL